MSGLDGTGAPTEGVVGEERSAPEEARLPLRELDRALAPVRRMASFALGSGVSRVRFLGRNLEPHITRALTLELPEALRDALQDVAGELVGLDDAPEEERARRLSSVAARVTRVDAIAGLPVRPSFRPIQKARQVDRPEEPAVVPGPPPSAAPAPRSPVVVAPVAPVAAVVPVVDPAPALAPERRDEEEEDDGPAEFAGDLSHALVDVAGCPPDIAGALAAVGVETVRDLAWIRPSMIETFEPVHGAGRELPVETPPVRVAVGGRAVSGWTVLQPTPDGVVRRRWTRLVGAGPLAVQWADDVPEWRERHKKLVVVGRATRLGDRTVLLDAEPAEADGHTVRLASWGLAGVPERRLRALWASLAPGLQHTRDPLAPETLRRFGLGASGPAIADAQIRCSPAGVRRMAFDEALLVQIGGILPRLQPGRDRGIGLNVLHQHVGRLGQTADLVLGDSAQAAFEEIKRDLRRPVPMRRVLVSEVGAGKGRIAICAAVTAAEAKSQVVIVGAGPTDAETRFVHAEPLLRELGLVARLVIGTAPSGVREALRRGEVHVVFGTPELIEDETLEFRRLGLVVAFERDVFGRMGVRHDAMTSPRPHLLVVPSVPVGPRVLVTAYADFQVSLVTDEQRRPARISLCRAHERVQAYLKVREAIDRGQQGLVVFPMVEGRDAVDIPEALRLVRALESDTLRGLRVELLHGSLPREEQARVYDDFTHRRVQVLVSTTRMEDAPTVPGLSVVVVEQADRVEQWRLHRIIGFLSRSDAPAEAILVVGETAESDAAARIDRVVSAPDGFRLTEALVKLRGTERCVAPGTSPPPSWRWFEPDEDLELLLAARDEAHRLLRLDAGLRRGSGPELASSLRTRWSVIWPDGAERGWVCSLRDDGTNEPRRKRRRRRRKR